MPLVSAFCIDGAQMQVLAALRSRQGAIAAAEQRFRVDRRAIAGAIAWEMLKNPPDWKRRILRSVSPIPRSVGWGKVHLYNFSGTGAVAGLADFGPLGGLAGALDFHTIAEETEEAGYLPKRSFFQRKKVLATPEGAITYIAAIMAAIADLAGEYGFDDIRSNPSILTNVYQGETLSSWEEKLKLKPRGTDFVAGNEMAIWVQQNGSFLQEAVGDPDIPESAPAVPGPEVTITYNALTPMMSLKTQQYVKLLAQSAGVKSINISFTTNGKHAAGSNHYNGTAVDISQVDGAHVYDYDKNVALAAGVQSLQEWANSSQIGIAHENYGPAGLYKDGKSFVNTKLQSEHENHIHITIPRSHRAKKK
ncbi:MAG: hypothetical protein ACLQLC_04970 [Candidatus Sulfotelmatobacter sp.]